MVRPAALVFDWDNTLVDAWAGIVAALNEVFAQFGRPAWTVQQARERIRGSMRESFPPLFGDHWEAARANAGHVPGTEPNWPALLAQPNVKLHLYGKREARLGRKMGHLTALAHSVDEAERIARAARTAMASR